MRDVNCLWKEVNLGLILLLTFHAFKQKTFTFSNAHACRTLILSLWEHFLSHHFPSALFVDFYSYDMTFQTIQFRHNTRFFVFSSLRSDQNKRIKLLVSKSKTINKIRCFICALNPSNYRESESLMLYSLFTAAPCCVWFLFWKQPKRLKNVIHETIFKTWWFCKINLLCCVRK